MRITGGQARGRRSRIPVPDGVRPTGSRVREALFDIVGHDLSGLRFLDAFGGSGLVGLEAWSRGAEVTVVECMPKVLAQIRARGQDVGAHWRLCVGDVLRQTAQLGSFDLVFADPPYAVDAAPVLSALAPCVGRRLVYETDSREPPPPVDGLVLSRVRRYGRSALWVFDAP